jgi:hypothetical protein
MSVTAQRAKSIRPPLGHSDSQSNLVVSNCDPARLAKVCPTMFRAAPQPHHRSNFARSPTRRPQCGTIHKPARSAARLGPRRYRGFGPGTPDRDGLGGGGAVSSEPVSRRENSPAYQGINREIVHHGRTTAETGRYEGCGRIPRTSEPASSRLPAEGSLAPA